MEEIIKKIDGIKKLINDAFEKGAIDFDQITDDLQRISNELRAGENSSDCERPRQHPLKTKDLSEKKGAISVGDYK